MIAIGLLLAFTNYNKLKELLHGINPIYLLYAIASAIIVYVMEGVFLFTALRIFNERLPLLTSIKYSLIINSVGYFISLGGLTPFATQIYILDYHNIETRKAALTRILQVIFFNILFAILLIIGLVSILFNRDIKVFNLTIIVIVVFLFFLLFAGLYLAIFWRVFRLISIKIIFGSLNKLVKLFAKNFHLSSMKAVQFLDDFSRGFNVLFKRPKYLMVLIGVAAVDWVLWLSVMYFSFLAFNYRIDISAMIIGFSIGQVVAIISMVPGGLGTMEGSMALTFAALNIPLGTAIGSVLFYRLSFHIIPFFLSLPFYFSLKHKIQR